MENDKIKELKGQIKQEEIRIKEEEKKNARLMWNYAPPIYKVIIIVGIITFIVLSTFIFLFLAGYVSRLFE